MDADAGLVLILHALAMKNEQKRMIDLATGDCGTFRKYCLVGCPQSE